MWFLRGVPVFMSVPLLGCTSVQEANVPGEPESSQEAVPQGAYDIGQPAWALASLGRPGDESWQHVALPGKRVTHFVPVQVDGQPAMSALAGTSASMLRKRVRVEAKDLQPLRFSWKVPALIPGADMGERDADDAPVRVVLAFEGDRRRFSPKNAMLSEMARMLTGEELPYATLMYVWCNQRAPGSVILNPRTDRIRKLVVESGSQGLGQWRGYVRDVRADFIQAYGEDPGALVAIGIMTDSDNTGTTTRAWYGPLQWSPASISSLP